MVELGSFYEKVVKVKADVAAILKFFLPMPQIEANQHEAAPGAPIGGGSRGIDVCQRFLLAHSVPAAWGEPARHGFPPGETGKGVFRLPCCRRQFALA